ncbi:LysR family transcriptional regulator [Liquorilactobacillus uvarum]|uniref:LysR family transcriptional regulator n=1 Tax=Liquorilactobacillus uvarum TaxID=303240 RepID=UPI00288C5B0D|nr:LysR family transcriptional regulator [Liquorilactobacillus uvarum]
MNLRHLEFFRDLAHTQHMSKTAEKLGISQPSLSYAIDSLEKELGFPLFKKNGRNIKLTHLGKVYLQFVQKGLDEIERGNALLQRLLNVNEGTVNLGFTYTPGQSLVPEIIKSFQKEKANCKISFNFIQGNTQQLLTALLEEKCDFVFSSFSNHVGNLNTTDILDFRPLVQQEIVLAVPADHPLARCQNINIEDLAQYPLIYFSKQSGLRPLIDSLFKKNSLKPKILFEIEEDHTIIGFVRQGLGIALVPRLPLSNCDSVKMLHINESAAKHQLYLVLKNNYFLTPSASKMQNFITEYCFKNFTSQNKMI